MQYNATQCNVMQCDVEMIGLETAAAAAARAAAAAAPSGGARRGDDDAAGAAAAARGFVAWPMVVGRYSGAVLKRRDPDATTPPFLPRFVAWPMVVAPALEPAAAGGPLRPVTRTVFLHACPVRGEDAIMFHCIHTKVITELTDR